MRAKRGYIEKSNGRSGKESSKGKSFVGEIKIHIDDDSELITTIYMKQ